LISITVGESGREPAEGFTFKSYEVISKNKLNKTFNNGSLGSGIDEERSEMR
jgi:hypothetical protein